MNHASLTELSKAGEILPGDILLFRNGERGLLNAGIRYAQRQALADLLTVKGADFCLLSEELIALYSSFTHAAQIGCSDNDDQPWPKFVYEQYAPHARTRMLAEIPAGTVVMVKRPKNRTDAAVAPVLSHWARVCNDKEPYPIRELAYYYCKWTGKVWFGRHFASVFKDTRPHHNVCSGEVVCASKDGGWFKDEPPEAWYPARLAYDDSFTDKIMEVMTT